MPRTLRSLLRDETGSTIIEFSLVGLLFFIMTFGVIEGGRALYQWNSATKAAQLGARLAAVSDPVWSGLPTFASTGTPGSPWVTDYDVTCQGTSTSAGNCSGTPGGAAYSASAMNRLVFGRNPESPPCGGQLGADRFPGMCDIYQRLEPQNVTVEYRNTGLGFVARPGGPVPTITVRLTGLTFEFIALDTLLGIGPIAMPEFEVTMTGEDLNAAAVP